MSDTELKTQLRSLAQEALEVSQADDSELMPGQGGTALFHLARDSEIVELPSFAPAVAALESLPQFAAIAELSEAKRVVLQFIYDFFERQITLEFWERAFEATWSSFWDELAKPEWTYLAICYLENLQSDANMVELGDNITVHNRSSYPFREVGWSDFQIKKLHEEWDGRSLYVLVAETRARKSPDNLILQNAADPVNKASRMVRALRLAKEGDVHIGGTGMIGRILATRPVGSGFHPSSGAAIVGQPPRWPGAPYLLSAADAPYVLALYKRLETVEGQADSAPYNLSLALRAFASSYDRIPAQSDTRTVDLITAAEALVGTTVESSFRLASRIAGILAESDRERVTIFDEMRAFYDARSRVVHGDKLEPSHQTHLNNYPTLRDYLRRLLVAFLHLATTPGHQYGSKSLRKGLDSLLLDAQQRSALRIAMGLEQEA